MKKVLLSFLLMLLPILASATYINGINYYLDLSTETASVCPGSYSGNVNIPSQVTYDGVTYTVTSIRGQSFPRSKVTSVTIPSSVTKLEEESFSGFTGIIHITDLEAWCKVWVHPAAFMDEKGKDNYHRLYLNGVEITDLVIPSGVTSISTNTFSYCTSITSVNILNSVESIGSQAFYNCSGLTSVTIANGVTSIGNSAFYGCSGLTSVTIPSSVTSIGSSAFSGTQWFNNQPNGLVYAGKVAYKYKGDMPENTSIIIEDGTVEIAPGAFSGCSGLTSVTIPNSVKSIGQSAFYNCI